MLLPAHLRQLCPAYLCYTSQGLCTVLFSAFYFSFRENTEHCIMALKIFQWNNCVRFWPQQLHVRCQRFSSAQEIALLKWLIHPTDVLSWPLCISCPIIVSVYHGKEKQKSSLSWINTDGKNLASVSLDDKNINIHRGSWLQRPCGGGGGGVLNRKPSRPSRTCYPPATPSRESPVRVSVYICSLHHVVHPWF